MLLATAAGLFVSPLLLLLVEWGIGRVRFGETFLGALLAVCFFGCTSLVVALFPVNRSLTRAVVVSYVLKVAIVGLGLWFISATNFDREIAAASVMTASICYLGTQTTYVIRRKGRIRRRAAHS